MTEEARYRLIIVSPDEPAREQVIDRPLVLIGRDSTRADLVLPHAWVSRAHARIYCDREPYRVEDLGSSNGTLLNDLPLAPNEPRPLKPGDVIAIGPFRLTLEALLPEPETPSEGTMEEPASSGTSADQAAAPSSGPEPPAVDMAILERLGTRRATRDRGVPPPPEPPETPTLVTGPAPVERWIGMPRLASRWLQYLPPIYAEDDFVGRYLLVFEDLLGPIQQIVAHWDLFLDPDTAPLSFLPWLNDWMAHLVDEHWSPETQRELLRKSSWLHQARGTALGLVTHLQIATGCDVSIEENADGPHTFRVILSAQGKEIDQRIVERIIDLNRPAHTTYTIRVT
ncbi:MAG: phage tail protein I [Anaerolineae bacterium]